MRWQSPQKLAIEHPIVGHAKGFPGVSSFIYRDEYRKVLVCIAPDKLFHIAAAPPCAWGFAEVYAKPRCSAFIASLFISVLDAKVRQDLSKLLRVRRIKA